MAIDRLSFTYLRSARVDSMIVWTKRPGTSDGRAPQRTHAFGAPEFACWVYALNRLAATGAVARSARPASDIARSASGSDDREDARGRRCC